MAYLQLAEENPYNRLAEAPVMSKYIFIPGGMFGQATDTYVREDFFDDLPIDQYKQVIATLAPYQNTGMHGILDTAVSFIPGVGPVASKGLQIASKLLKKRQERVAAGTAKPIFKQGGLVDRIKGKLQGAKAASGDTTQKLPNPIDIQASGSIGGTTFNVGTQTGDQTFWQKYKKPILIGGGAVAVGTLAYLALRKKKRK